MIGANVRLCRWSGTRSRQLTAPIYPDLTILLPHLCAGEYGSKRGTETSEVTRRPLPRSRTSIEAPGDHPGQPADKTKRPNPHLLGSAVPDVLRHHTGGVVTKPQTRRPGARQAQEFNVDHTRSAVLTTHVSQGDPATRGGVEVAVPSRETSRSGRGLGAPPRGEGARASRATLTRTPCTPGLLSNPGTTALPNQARAPRQVRQGARLRRHCGELARRGPTSLPVCNLLSTI